MHPRSPQGNLTAPLSPLVPRCVRIRSLGGELFLNEASNVTLLKGFACVRVLCRYTITTGLFPYISSAVFSKLSSSLHSF